MCGSNGPPMRSTCLKKSVRSQSKAKTFVPVIARGWRLWACLATGQRPDSAPAVQPRARHQTTLEYTSTACLLNSLVCPSRCSVRMPGCDFYKRYKQLLSLRRIFSYRSECLLVNTIDLFYALSGFFRFGYTAVAVAYLQKTSTKRTACFHQ